MKIMQGLVLGWVFYGLSGCAALDVAIVGDSVTTYAAIQSGVAMEANPVLVGLTGGKPFSTAVLAAGAGYATAHGAKHLSPPACFQTHRVITATKLAATANNLAVILGSSGNAPLVLGVLVGLAAYNGKHIRNSSTQFCS